MQLSLKLLHIIIARLLHMVHPAGLHSPQPACVEALDGTSFICADSCEASYVGGK